MPSRGGHSNSGRQQSDLLPEVWVTAAPTREEFLRARYEPEELEDNGFRVTLSGSSTGKSKRK